MSSKPKRIYVATSVKNISVIYNCTHSDPINLLRQTPCWLPTRCERHSINSFVCSKSGVPRTSRFHLALVRVTREVIIREGSRTVGVIYQDWWLVFFFFMKERRSADFCANHAVPPFVPRISQQVCYFTNDCHHVLISTLMTVIKTILAGTAGDRGPTFPSAHFHRVVIMSAASTWLA